MTFIWPTVLFLLLLLPLFVGYYLILQMRRQEVVARYRNLGLLQQSEGRRSGFSRHIPQLFFLLSLAILIIAMARPQMVLSLPRVEGTVILAFDVSGSMAADDLKPSRMEAAKTSAREFIQRRPRNMQIGIVAFSDSGFTVQAPTSDQDVLLAAINRLTPQRGTSLANGILVSLKTIASGGQTTHFYSNLTPAPTPTPTAMPKGTYTSAVIVLLTDGENNESPDPLAAAQAAVDRGVRIYTVGIGSTAGTNVHINGFTVHTQLDEAALQQISQLTDATYYNAQNEKDLTRIYDTISTQLVIKPEETEITSIFAGSGILLLLLGGTFSLLWFNRMP